MNKGALQHSVTNYYNDVAQRYYKDFFANAGEYPPLLFRQMHILQMLDVEGKENKSVLDAGCGTGDLLKELFSGGFGRLEGIDISDSMVSIASENCKEGIGKGKIRIQAGSVLALPFADSSFDIVVCSGLVEYLSDDEEWVKEVKRVLKKDGILVVNVTNKIAVRRWTLGPVVKLKKLSVLRSIASFIKSKVLRKGQLNHFPFEIRTHVPDSFDSFLRMRGFEKVEHRYFDFSILPYPLDTVFNKQVIAKRKKMETTAYKDYKWNGTGYIVKVKLLNK